MSDLRNRYKFDIKKNPEHINWALRKPTKDLGFFHRHPKFTLWGSLVLFGAVFFCQPIYDIFFADPRRKKLRLVDMDD